MTTVFVSVFQDEALVLQSMLQSAEIESEVIVDGMLDINPLFATDIRGARLIVSDEEAEDAALIVAEYRKVHNEAG